MNIDLIRAWKDDSYRQSLNEEQLGLLPANPAGELELSETDLQSVYGIGDGGFGHNNFNRLQVSFRCSIECSLDCDIKKVYIINAAQPVAGLNLGPLHFNLGGSGAATQTVVPSTDSLDDQ